MMKNKKEEFYDEKNDKRCFQGMYSSTDWFYFTYAAVYMLLLPASTEDAGGI